MNKLIKKIIDSERKSAQGQAGMTYVELIVVLSIFSVLSSVVIFNYGDFQGRVDIKGLASDIALKVVEAQKSSLNGVWNLSATSSWKPSYGVYFNLVLDNKSFIYFVDLNNLNGYEAGAEKLDTISVTKGNYIERIDKCTGVTCIPSVSINSLAVSFKRPDSSAVFKDPTNPIVIDFDYIQITIASSRGATALIKLYPSGRVEIN